MVLDALDETTTEVVAGDTKSAYAEGRLRQRGLINLEPAFAKRLEEKAGFATLAAVSTAVEYAKPQS
jgi:hypothetical protein